MFAQWSLRKDEDEDESMVGEYGKEVFLDIHSEVREGHVLVNSAHWMRREIDVG